MNKEVIALKRTMLESQGIYLSFDEPNAAGKTAFLFTGHGSQYPNMMKELADKYPVVKEVFQEADAVYNELTGRKLTDIIFYNDEAKKAEAENNLKDAVVMQPAIVVANLALYKLMKSICKNVDVHIGHSLGEVAALAAADVVSFADAVRIAYYRGYSVNLVDKASRGTMLSLKLNRSSELLGKVLNGVQEYHTVSLHNSPEQVVISGTFEAIDKIALNCDHNSVTYNKLNVSHAFHSQLLEPAVGYYKQKLMEFKFNTPKVKVYSTILDAFYTEQHMKPETMADILSSQLIKPFSFCDIITKLNSDYKVDRFIEVGPKDILTKQVKNILAGKSIYSHASNVPAVGDIISLERVVAYMTVNRLLDNSGTVSAKTEANIEQKIIDIVQYITGYPKNHIKLSNEPLKLSLALNKRVFENVIEKVRTDFIISEDDLPTNDTLSLVDIYNIVSKKLGIEAPQAQAAEVKEAPKAAPAPVAAPAAAVASADTGAVTVDVKEIIQAKTGYPVDMLEGDLDLEADLGIDSVKQAEIFGQIREKFGYAANPDLNIKQFNTITKIVEYTMSQLGSAPAAEVAKAEAAVTLAAPVVASADAGVVTVDVKEIIQAKTGYPVDMLEGDLDLEADLGIDSVKQAEIFGQIREKFGYAANPDLNIKQFNTITKIVEYTMSQLGSAPAAEPVQAEAAVTLEAPVAAADSGAVTVDVKEIIQAKTGYPVDMLEGDLDLEADLGIDSVKQAEIFGQIREKFGYAANPDLNIKQFNTIDKIVEYTMSQLGSAPAAEPVQAEAAVTLEAPVVVADAGAVTVDVKEIIQAKTGYPVDMLEGDLDLEADLGIDSVKQAEIFGQIREKFGYAANPDLNIKQFNTIDKIVEYTISQLGSSPAPASAEVTKAKAQITDKELLEKINAYAGESIATRFVPVTMEKMFDTADGRAFSFKNKKFIIIEDRMGGEITTGIVSKINESGGLACVLSPNAGKYDAYGVATDFDNLEAFKASLEEAKKQLKDVHGFIYLYPLVKDFSYFDCDDNYWSKEVDNSFNLLFYTAKAIYDDIEKHGFEAGCFAATATGGVFGMERQTSYNPMGAITAGFIKSLEKEFDNFSGKVVDLTDVNDPKAVSDLLFKEFSLIEKLIEIGYVNNKRKTICVVPHNINTAATNEPLKLTSDDVILVSGGGRGILFESVKGLAEVYNPTIIITGRTSLPQGNEEWLNMSDAEFEEYGKKFFIEMKSKNPRMTPIMIKQELEKLKSAGELFNNIKAINEAGFNMHYIRCDVANKDSVKKLAEEIKARFGKVTGIINGAGLPSFGKVPKKPEQHSLTVVRVKAHGFYNLYREFSDQPLKFFTSIGSISGRFGMDGQVDYAGGADIIVRMSFQMFRKRPDMKCFVIGWTAWDEVGMASNPEVQKVQKEQRGLDYISKKEGIYRFLCELVYGGDYPETLYYGSLGTNLPLGQMDMLSEDGKSTKHYFAKHGEVANRIDYPLLQRVTSLTETTIEAEKDLDIEEDIYLKDHMVEGKYVYAGVMHVEAFYELGKMLNAASSKDSGMYATSIRNLEFKKFVKYFEGSPLTMRLKADVIKNDGVTKEIQASIKSDFVNRKGMVLEKDRLHSDGVIIYENQPLPQIKADVDVLAAIKASKPMNIDKYYECSDKYISFGPTFRCLDYVGYINEEVLVGQVTVPHDNEIFSYAPMADTIISPITIDNLGRLMLFIDFQKHGNIIVPKLIADAKLYRPFKKGEKVYIYCKQLTEEGETVTFRAQIVDEDNNLIFDMVDLHLIRIAKEHGDHNLL